MTALEIKVMRLRIKNDGIIAFERLIRIRDRELIPALRSALYLDKLERLLLKWLNKK